MGEFEKIQTAIDSERDVDRDCSVELADLTCKLSALAHLMLGNRATIENDEISGIGGIIYHFTEELEEITQRLYGD